MNLEIGSALHMMLLLLASALRISVPYALAAVGATLSERSGVINIAVEGIMLNSALGYVLGAHWGGNPWAGLVAALLAGAMTAWLHAEVTIRFRADQITSGLGINLLAMGLTRFVLQAVFHSSSNSPRVVGFAGWPLLDLGGVPWAGPALAATIGSVLATPLFSITLLVIVLTQWLLFHTVFGLRLRSIGERPEAAATLGLSVVRYRFAGVIGSGLCAALAGAWLASEQHSFTDGMTGGRGYIAIAAMIVGKWSPWAAAVACLLFGASEALQIQLQGSGFPSELLQMIPYVLTMFVLAGFIGRATPPRSLGTPFDPEKA